MSLIIEQNHQNQFINKALYVKGNFHRAVTQNLVQQLKKIFSENFNLVAQIEQTFQQVIFRAKIGQIFELYQLFIILKINWFSQKIFFKTFINHNCLPFKISSRKLINDFLKNANHYNMKRNDYSLYVLIKHGQPIISICYFLSSTLFNSKSFSTLSLIKKTIELMIDNSKSILSRFIILLNGFPKNFKFNKGVFNQNQKLQDDQDRLNKIYQHLSMMNIQRDLSIKISSQQNLKNNLDLNIIKPLNINQSNIDQLNQSILKQSMLSQQILSFINQTKIIYGYTQSFQKKNHIQDLNQNQIKILRHFILKPAAKQSINKGQNKFIFNLIKILNKNQIKFKILKENNNQIIKYTLIKYIYMSSVQENLISFSQMFQMPKTENVLQKIVFLKTPKTQKHRLKLEHQLKVLNLLKYSHSPHFFKYYRSFQHVHDHDFSGALMDASNYTSLGQYFDKNLFTMSLRTKLYLLIQVIQGLRVLKDIKVVHMNLNLQNIVVMKDLNIKIIDFTQAYNQSICQQDYILDYIMPFSCPEMLLPGHKEFCQYQDIFTFGIIAFVILFNQLPFQKVPNLINYYSNKTYMHKLYLVSQKIQDFMLDQISYILLRLILQCLHPNQEKRPSSTWIQVIMKQIIFVVTKL